MAAVKGGVAGQQEEEEKDSGNEQWEGQKLHHNSARKGKGHHSGGMLSSGGCRSCSRALAAVARASLSLCAVGAVGLCDMPLVQAVVVHYKHPSLINRKHV